ncbi:accessory factor UbiK family protein [Zooshikella harenae]|uniref:Ubiquinone biosynthesis accessory factor UbiK n=1 Tax=Zooshikella harenae TaxID=2827238 RepID=A0ABS5ZH30_9GAMM|nr:accessory factor UbiK family protein [Zooshikella harenae]
MINKAFIQSLSEQISSSVGEKVQQLMSGEKPQIQKDIESNIHILLQTAFAKLDLVTREQFEDQLAVLQHTRAKLEALELKVAALEAHLAAEEKPAIILESAPQHLPPEEKDN